MAAQDQLKKAIDFLAPKALATPAPAKIPTYQPELINSQGIAEAQMMYGQGQQPPNPAPPGQQKKGWGKT